MNIQAYITSGILELYVHGLASPAEMKEVEELAALHPEIQLEIDAIAQALESYAVAHQVLPPDGLKDKIMGRLDGPPAPPPRSGGGNNRPAAAAVSSREADGPSKSIGIVTALLILALIGACAAAFLFLQQAKKAQAAATEAQAHLEQVKKDCEDKEKRNVALQDQFINIRHWATRPVQMKGTALNKEAFAVVYRNDVKQVSFLDVVNLPPPAANKQYQLWAIVKGQPTDMGVFDLTSENGMMQSVKFIENAEAYAVTLEPKGGSASPTLDQMYVVGAVRS